MSCLSNADVARSEHLAFRKMFRSARHPVVGDQVLIRPPWVVAPEVQVEPVAGPVLGEANDYLFDTLLQLTPVERERLSESMR
jgi:hypothetical protein